MNFNIVSLFILDQLKKMSKIMNEDINKVRNLKNTKI